MIINKIKNYFHFTRGETNALAIIIITIVILIVFRITDVYYSNNNNFDKDQYLKELNEFLKFLESGNNENSVKKNMDTIEASITEIKYFKFDPNSIEYKDILKLGISNHLAQTWVNFRNRGGKFRNAQDILRIYGMDHETFNKLKPYVIINNNGLIEIINTENDYFIKEEIYVELNTADTGKLINIPGIGSYFANAIVNYRQRLGGFYKTEQLLEVYLFDTTRLNQVYDYIYLDTNYIFKHDLNTIEYINLVRHPYIERKHANAIINYRNQHGALSNIFELLNIHIIDSAFIKRIEAYFYVQNKNNQ